MHLLYNLMKALSISNVLREPILLSPCFARKINPYPRQVHFFAKLPRFIENAFFRCYSYSVLVK